MATVLPAGGFNENAMMELIKFKMMSNIGGSNDDSIYTLFYNMMIVMVFGCMTKYVGKLFSKLKTYFVNYWYGITKDHNLSDFKYRMNIRNNKYLNIIVYLITRDNVINHKYKTDLIERTMADSYLTEDLDGVAKYLYLDSNCDTFIPLKKLGFNELLYYCCAKESDHHALGNYLACNTSLTDIVNFLKEIENKYLSKVATRICYTDNISGNVKSMITHKTLDNIFFEQKDQVIKILEQFKNENWYKDRGIARHLGLLLCGTPGCGKTSFIKAIAHHYKKNIHNVDLSKVKTKTIFGNIIDANDNSIIVFEDFDRIPCVIEMMNNDGRETTTNVIGNEYLDKLFKAFTEAKEGEKEKMLEIYKNERNKCDNDALDLAYILNILDGIIERSGRILIFTANRPELLSKALLRPGRIDYIIEFRKANRKIISEMLQHFFQTKTIPNIKKIKEYAYTPAEIIMICKKHNNLEKVVSELQKGKICADANKL